MDLNSRLRSLKTAWALREPDWILPFVLLGSGLAAAGLIWLSMTQGPADGVVGTVNGRVEALAIHLGKHNRVGYVRASAEGRKWYFVLPINTDCRVGDVIVLSKRGRRREGFVLSPAFPHPCRRPTPFSQQ